MNSKATMNRRSRARYGAKISKVLIGLGALAVFASTARAQQPDATPSTQPVDAIRSTQPVDSIRSAAVEFIRSQLPHDGQIVEITASGLDDRLRLTRCATPLDAEPTGASQIGRSTVAVSCAAPVRWRIYVPITVVRRESVLVLRHAVAREAVLTPADVTIESRRVTGLAAPYLDSPAELHGRAARRTLAAGTALTVDMLTPDLIVHRGQEVTLVVQTGGFEVRAMGQALEDAAAGARIHVANAGSRKIVEGIVESADTVRVAD